MKVATDAFFGAVKIAANAWDGLRAAWVITVAFLKNAWTSFTSTLASAHRKAVGFVTKQLLKLRGLFDESFDTEAAIEIAQAETKADLKAIERRKAAALAASDKQREKDLARIGQENLDTLAALDKQAAAANQRRQQQAQQEINAATQELENARREYEAALAEAAKKREQTERGINTDDAPTSLDKLIDQFRGIGDQLENAAKRSVEVRGTFNAAAIQGLMSGGSAMDRTADASEETARNTKRIQREIKTSNLAFA
jgi:DNA repair exonuclease SbcCD ATPase subunit